MNKPNNSEKQTRFVRLLDPDYKIWLSKLKDDNTVTRCKLCRSFIKLSPMGQSSLNDHADGSKHLESVKRLRSFFKKP